MSEAVVHMHEVYILPMTTGSALAFFILNECLTFPAAIEMLPKSKLVSSALSDPSLFAGKVVALLCEFGRAIQMMPPKTRRATTIPIIILFIWIVEIKKTKN